MLRVRVVSPTPADAEAVSAQLVERGFDVEVASADVPSGAAVDFELHLERSTIREAVLRAGSEQFPKMMVVAPGLLARREIAISKVACQQEAAYAQDELAATGTYGPASALPLEVKVVSLGEGKGRFSQDAMEECFLLAVRKAQFEAMRGFAAPTERNRASVFVKAEQLAARVCRARFIRNLPVALGRAASLAAALFGSISSSSR
jgi:hypothetical protein